MSRILISGWISLKSVENVDFLFIAWSITSFYLKTQYYLGSSVTFANLSIISSKFWSIFVFLICCKSLLSNNTANTGKMKAISNSTRSIDIKANELSIWIEDSYPLGFSSTIYANSSVGPTYLDRSVNRPIYFSFIVLQLQFTEFLKVSTLVIHESSDHC